MTDEELAALGLPKKGSRRCAICGRRLKTGTTGIHMREARDSCARNGGVRTLLWLCAKDGRNVIESIARARKVVREKVIA